MIRKGILIILTVFHLFSCAQSDNPAEQRSWTIKKDKNTIYIAATSAWGSKRNLLKQGIDLAAEQLNSLGGILGRKLEILYYDDERSLNTGQQMAYKIAEDNRIAAVIGHSASFISVPTSLIYQYYGVLMLSPLSTNAKLTQQNFDLVFRNIPTDKVFGQAAAEYCYNMNWNRVLIYNADNDYGQSLANIFEMESRTKGLTIVDRVSYDSYSTTLDFKETAVYWKNNYDFDVLFLAGTVPKAAEIVRTLREEGISCPIVGGDALDHPMLLEIAGEAANDVYSFTIYNNENTSPAFNDFKTAFFNRYSEEPDQAALQGYDALMVLVEGMKNAGSPDPKKVSEALHSLPEWKGAAGPYNFIPSGDVENKDVFLKVVKNGEYTLVP